MTVKEKKDIRYNVRMTQSIFDIVDSFEGNNFTAKFDNMVNHCFLEKDKIELEINQSKEELKKLQSQIYEMNNIKQSLSEIENYIDNAIRYTKHQNF